MKTDTGTIKKIAQKKQMARKMFEKWCLDRKRVLAVKTGTGSENGRQVSRKQVLEARNSVLVGLYA